MTRRIRDIPEPDRPREKLLRNGAAALSDQELLAVLLDTSCATTGGALQSPASSVVTALRQVTTQV